MLALPNITARAGGGGAIDIDEGGGPAVAAEGKRHGESRVKGAVRGATNAPFVVADIQEPRIRGKGVDL